MAVGILVAGFFAGIALRASGTGGAPAWLGRTRGQWVGGLVLAALLAVALAGYDWWVDRRAGPRRRP